MEKKQAFICRVLLWTCSLEMIAKEEVGKQKQGSFVRSFVQGAQLTMITYAAVDGYDYGYGYG